MKIYKRDVFDKIEPFLGDNTVIVLHGARQVGKTHILFFIRDYLVNQGKKVFYYDLEYPELLMDLNKGVEVFIADLKGKGYTEGEDIFVFIDEIQYLDVPSSFLKIVADHYKNIHLIVSGSSTFDIKSKFSDSLAGRTMSFEVYPLSFVEFLRFKEVNLELDQVVSSSGIERLIEMYEEFVKFGGYPRIVLESSEEKKKAYLLQIIDTYVRKDVRDLAKIEDIKKFNNLLYVLAAQSGKLLDLKALSNETGLIYATLRRYLTVLEETYVVKLVSPFSRSPSVEISKNPKLFFYDSGLQVLLWLKNFQQTLLGSVFETNIFGELAKKYGRNNIHFWRTKSQQEIDFIIEKNNGLCPLEVKINFGNYEDRAMKAFMKKYKIDSAKVVGLRGEKGGEGIYPWML